MEKRALSHIEFILSFIIFIGAVSFSLYFFNPTVYAGISDNSLEYFTQEIRKNVSVDLFTYAVMINASADQLAEDTDGKGNSKKVAILMPSDLPDSLNVKVTNYLSEESINFKDNVRAYNFKEEPQDTFTLCVRLSKGKNPNVILDSFLYVYLSQDISDSTQTGKADFACPTVNQNLYYGVSSYQRKIVSEKRLLLLNESYYSDYSKLKKSFNIPSSRDFSFKVVFQDKKEIIAKSPTSSREEVLSLVKHLEVLRSESGKVEFADLYASIW